MYDVLQRLLLRAYHWLINCGRKGFCHNQSACARSFTCAFKSALGVLGQGSLGLFNRLPRPSWAALRLMAVVLSIIAVIVIQNMPNHTRTLHFNPNHEYVLFADGQRGGDSQVAWMDDYSSSRFKCNVSTADEAWCGISILWPSEPHGLMDFSHFQSLRVKLKYVGDAKRLRIYVRNYDEAYGDLIDTDPNKFQSVTLYAYEFNEVVSIPLSQFVVAEWWVRRFNVPRQHVALDFTAIQMLAIDFPQPGAAGEHVMELQSIELVGELVAKESAYFILLVLWLLVLGAEGVYRYYQMNHRMSMRVERERARALSLASYARELRTQTSMYKRLSSIDPLTGAYNRSGIKAQLKKSFAHRRSGALMVIDIDHFKGVNDTYGHNVGDQVIKGVAQVMSDAIRANDVFARWGGEEFLLLCPEANRVTAAIIGEKLRQAVSDIQHEPDALMVSISLGVTVIRDDDTFERAFERADQALYQAKRAGRNRVIFFEHDESFA